MSYALGVDLGTTYTAAAIGRGADAQPLQLGTDAAQVPSVVLVRDDGTVMVGDAAERRAAAEPARAAREFKRRLGDPVPIVIGGTPYSVAALMAMQLRDIVRVATEQQGEAPARVVLTHPANYSDFKRQALLEAAALAGLDAASVQLLTEPEAAAVAYSRQQRIEPGDVVAIYDFGGGTFDAALVRNTGSAFELIGVPEGMERLGGIDFDQAVLGHVDRTVDGLVSGADRSNPDVLPAQNRLRIDCRRAKEALSSDGDATIAVDVPGVHTSVRLTRAEFEQMVRPRVAETVTALQRAVASAGLSMEQVSRILLVGGSSRMPIVGEMVRAATGRPVALDTHPKLAIATGAALVGGAAVGLPAPAAAPAAPAAAWTPPVRTEAPLSAPKKSRTPMYVGAGLALGALAVGAFFVFGGSDDASVATTPTSLPVTSSTVPQAGATTTVPGQPPTSTAAPTSAPTTVAPSGSPFTVSLFAFGGAPGSGIPGPAAAAGLASPSHLATDGATTYLTDGALQVLRVAGGNVDVLGSLDTASGSIGGLTVMAGEVYVTAADGVWKFTNGTPAIVVDPGAASLGNEPGPITHDAAGNLYFADNANHRVLRRGADGSLSLIAGNGNVPAAGAHTDDGQPAGTAAIGTLSALAIDPTGRLLLGDATALTVRSITPDGIINTIAADQQWSSVSGVTADANGRVYVADDTAGRIARVGTAGAVESLISRITGGAVTNDVSADQSSVGTLGSVAMGADGLLFVDGSTVRLITG